MYLSLFVPYMSKVAFNYISDCWRYECIVGEKPWENHKTLL